MFCSHCGKQIPDNASFCPECGVLIQGQKTGIDHKIESDSNQWAFNHIPQGGQQNPNIKVVYAQPQVHTTGTQNNGNKRKAIGIAVAVIISFFAFFTIIYALIGLDTNSENSESTQSKSDEKENTTEANDDKSMLQGKDNYRIALVKDGCPVMIPNITYDEAYSLFFGNPNWKYFKSDDGSGVVEFEGECTYNTDPAIAYIQFTIDESEEGFDLSYASVKVDGKEIDDNTKIVQLIYNPFSQYSEEVLGEPLNEEVERRFVQWFNESMGLEEEPIESDYIDELDNQELFLIDGKETAFYWTLYNGEIRERSISKDELAGFTPKELTYLRNVIYAYHGYIFNSQELNDYYTLYSWYDPDQSFSTEQVNDVEENNAKTIREYQEENSLIYTPQ